MKTTVLLIFSSLILSAGSLKILKSGIAENDSAHFFSGDSLNLSFTFLSSDDGTGFIKILKNSGDKTVYISNSAIIEKEESGTVIENWMTEAKEWINDSLLSDHASKNVNLVPNETEGFNIDDELSIETWMTQPREWNEEKAINKF